VIDAARFIGSRWSRHDASPAGKDVSIQDKSYRAEETRLNSKLASFTFLAPGPFSSSEKQIRDQIGDVPEFVEMFDRLVEHLKAHEIDLAKPNVTLGTWLQIDRENERFKDHAEANELARGYYRAPYTVPALA